VAVVEGRDQGAKLSLGQADRVYLVGRAAHCDLALDGGDCSREHLHVTVRGGTVFIRDQGAKNGTQLGETRAPSDRDVAWRPATMIRIGRTVLALEEPVAPASPSLSEIAGLPVPVAVGGLDPNTTPERAKAKGGWSVTDLLVM